jgi:hypothetical protein
MDITFTVEDCLSEDSLLRPLMSGLWGEITMKYDSNSFYYSVNHPIDFFIFVDKIKDELIFSAGMELISITSFDDSTKYSDKTNTKIEICSVLFKECLLKIENIYKTHVIVNHEVRKYPIYQLLENSYTSRLLNRPYNTPSWKGFVLDPHRQIRDLYDGYLSIEQDGVEIYEIYRGTVWDSWKIICKLMEDMKAGTADPALYVLPIERMKSARKTE